MPAPHSNYLIEENSRRQRAKSGRLTLIAMSVGGLLFCCVGTFGINHKSYTELSLWEFGALIFLGFSLYNSFRFWTSLRRGEFDSLAYDERKRKRCLIPERQFSQMDADSIELDARPPEVETLTPHRVKHLPPFSEEFVALLERERSNVVARSKACRAELAPLMAPDFGKFLNRDKYTFVDVVEGPQAEYIRQRNLKPGYFDLQLEEDLWLLYSVRGFGAMPAGMSRKYNLVGVVTRNAKETVFQWQWTNPELYPMLSMFALNISVGLESGETPVEFLTPNLIFKDDHTLDEFFLGVVAYSQMRTYLLVSVGECELALIVGEEGPFAVNQHPRRRND